MPQTPEVIFGEFPSNLHYQEHLARYRFAATYVNGKLVMDLGCGARDGPYQLGEAAQKVVAVDYLPEQLKQARLNYARQGIAYACASALNLAFRENTFDVVTSLEVIEHFTADQQETYLAEVRRFIKPGGLFILSTPNRDIYPKEGRARSRHHLQELSYEEFGALLSRYFSGVEIFGVSRGKGVRGYAGIFHRFVRTIDVLNLRQFFSNRLKTKIYRTVAHKTGAKSADQVQVQDIDIIKEAAPNAPFLIAVCHKAHK